MSDVASREPGRPERSEANDYMFGYIDQVGPGDIRHILQQQAREAASYFATVSEEASLTRYEPGKWSMREALGHVSDTERVFAFRALWFARLLGAPLPGFSQDEAAKTAPGDALPWSAHVAEFAAVRAATLAMFVNLPDDAWLREGEASGRRFSVRAMAYITAGHTAHHLKILKERYSIT
ncbi:MAG TPA: DinB family protein [Trueperaceae bacterium]|nr:DinB family protein [Trueperaceae bacterium]